MAIHYRGPTALALLATAALSGPAHCETLDIHVNGQAHIGAATTVLTFTGGSPWHQSIITALLDIGPDVDYGTIEEGCFMFYNGDGHECKVSSADNLVINAIQTRTATFTAGRASYFSQRLREQPDYAGIRSPEYTMQDQWEEGDTTAGYVQGEPGTDSPTAGNYIGALPSMTAAIVTPRVTIDYDKDSMAPSQCAPTGTVYKCSVGLGDDGTIAVDVDVGTLRAALYRGPASRVTGPNGVTAGAYQGSLYAGVMTDTQDNAHAVATLSRAVPAGALGTVTVRVEADTSLGGTSWMNYAIHLDGLASTTPTCAVAATDTAYTTSEATGAVDLPTTVRIDCDATPGAERHPSQSVAPGSGGLQRLYVKPANGVYNMADDHGSWGWPMGPGVRAFFDSDLCGHADPSMTDPGSAPDPCGTADDFTSGQTSKDFAIGVQFIWDHPTAGTVTRAFIYVFEYY